MAGLRISGKKLRAGVAGCRPPGTAVVRSFDGSMQEGDNPENLFFIQIGEGRHALFYAALVEQWTDQTPMVIVANQEGVDQVWALSASGLRPVTHAACLLEQLPARLNIWRVQGVGSSGDPALLRASLRKEKGSDGCDRKAAAPAYEISKNQPNMCSQFASAKS